jgi:hypothetical protein
VVVPGVGLEVVVPGVGLEVVVERGIEPVVERSPDVDVGLLRDSLVCPRRVPLV